MKTELTGRERRNTAPAIVRYGVAVLSVTAALVIARLLQIQYNFEPLVPFLCAMMFGAWFGGVKPGILSAALSLLAFHYYFLIPIYPSGMEKEIPRLFVAAVTSLFIVFVSAAQRSATDSLRRARDALDGTVQELRRTNELLQRENAERRQAEEALKQAEDNLRFVLDATPSMIHTGRPDGYLDYFNQGWLKCVGLPLEGLQGWNWMAVIHPEDVEGEVSRWRACVASGESFEYEARVRRADGTYRWMLHRKVAVRDGHGNIVKWCGSSTDIDRRKQAEQMLKDSHAQLRALSARLQSVREEEATRIAREIHDDLGQKLTGLKMDLLRAERKIEELGVSTGVNSLLDTIVNATDLADGITATVQEIAANLRPEMLDKLGLSAALGCEARRFQERTGVLCEARVPETEPNLSPEVCTALFRIFQECLTNIARHAHAAKIEAELRSEDGWVTLRVQDNGRGITEAEIADPASLGLLGMKERTGLLGGEIFFQRGPEGGTIVTARIPKSGTFVQPTEPL
jgi:PAS domain S-box-containing protein